MELSSTNNSTIWYTFDIVVLRNRCIWHKYILMRKYTRALVIWRKSLPLFFQELSLGWLRSRWPKECNDDKHSVFPTLRLFQISILHC